MHRDVDDYFPAWRAANGGEDYALWLWGQKRRAERQGRGDDATHFLKLYRREDSRLRRSA